MSKYKLMDIFESFKDNLSPEEKERYDMLTSDDKDKLERIKALMDKEKVNIEKDAKKSMGMLKEMDLEVSQRIEGLLNMGMKNKFLDMGMDLIQDVLEEDEFDINDIISHLAYELGQHYDSFARQGDKLAGMEEGYGNEDGDKDDSPTEKETEKMRFKEEKDTSVKDLLDKIGKHLKGSDRNFQDGEIEMYIDSLKRDIKRGEFDGVESFSMEDHEEDLSNMIADKSLQEHFSRFMKDYQ